MSRLMASSMVRSVTLKQGRMCTGSGKISPYQPLPQGCMFSLQHQLPRLPVPPLEQTLNKFLKSVKPILSGDDYDRAEKIVSEFGKVGGTGEKLNGLLQEKADCSLNWLSDWWLHVAYLDYRLPVAITSSPAVVFPKQDYTDRDGQLLAAAKMISGVLDYKVKIDEQSLPIERAGGKPLCMMQFNNIFCSCRIPGEKRDSIVSIQSNEFLTPGHIIVAHNNHFFSVQVYKSNGCLVTIEELYGQLTCIMEHSEQKALPLGILTTENRDTWSKVYSELIEDEQNSTNMEKMHSAIFMVCIDEPQGPQMEDVTSFNMGQMNHGWGSRGNSGNRWFDKTLQFIVGTDGVMGLAWEHASAEGPPVSSIVEYALDYMAHEHPQAELIPSTLKPEQLKFNISRSIETAINDASRAFDMTIEDLDMIAFPFEGFGKEFIKSQKLSPDAFIQIAIQLAYFRLYGQSCATYESGSLRQFQHGRTDTIRSCSIASNHFCKAMAENSRSAEDQYAALKDAILSHRNFTIDVVNGQGIDRHLLGLKMIAIEHGLDVPEFFMDTIYTSSVHWQLSTSQVPSKHSNTFVFGPAVLDGYGICYNPMAYAINFGVSAWNSCSETDSYLMKKTIEGALVDIQKLCQQIGPKVDA